MYSDHDWNSWEFQRTPIEFWESIGNCKVFLEKIASRLGVDTRLDWNNISSEQIAKYGGTFITYNLR